MASWDADGEDGMMGRWQSWITRDDDYYYRRAEQSVTWAEWAAGMLIAVVLYGLVVGGVHLCAWLDAAGLVAGR